ncbi:MAG: AlpA family phage regulatory protein [Hyphomicrobiaceae bacterium TMED74]|nr:transcriptional regulator [Filomicrobium sp.]RPG43052.1 MAG: AlpA family phage regulatory protein [Hyphomicrobiaceae bacterium TMED74]
MSDGLNRLPQTDPADKLINRRQLREQIPTSDMTIWRWQQQGLFPKHISINGRNYWRQSEIIDWLANHDP